MKCLEIVTGECISFNRCTEISVQSFLQNLWMFKIFKYTRTLRGLIKYVPLQQFKDNGRLIVDLKLR